MLIEPISVALADLFTIARWWKTIAAVLCSRHRVSLWARDPAQAAAIVATMGAEGALAWCRGVELPVRPHPVQVVDTTGAGDAPDLPAVAFTSDYSRPGFERMGFLVIMRFTLWWRGHHG